MSIKRKSIEATIASALRQEFIIKNVKMINIHLLLLFVSFIWGSSFIATEIALKDVSVLTLLILRLGLASLIFILILVFRKDWKKKINNKDILYFLFLGLLSVSIYQLLQITANKLSNASITSFFISLHPIVLALLGIIVFKEKMNLYKIIGITAGFLGSIIIASKGNFTINENTNYYLALFCVILNSMMWGGYSTLAKKVSIKYSSFDVTALMTILGLIFFLPISLLLSNTFHINIIQETSKLSLKAIGAIIYLALICTITGYALWLYCINKLEISKAGYYLYLEPVFTIILAPFFVGNQLKVSLIIGGILIFIGLIFINIVKKRQISGPA